MITRREIIDAARSLVGTPYHHQGRVPGVGCDCVGVAVLSAQAVGALFHDQKRYAANPDGKTFLAHMRKSCDEIPVEEAKPGDVLMMFVSPRTKRPQHVAVMTDDDRVVQAHQGYGKVIEQRLTRQWKRRVVTAFRFRGVEGE